MVLEIIFLVLGIVALISIGYRWRRDNNKLDLFLIIVMVGILTPTILSVFNLTPLLVQDVFFKIYLGIFVVTLALQFLLYLKEVKKIYSLPIIIGFYMGISVAITNQSMVWTIYAAIASIFLISILIREGLKNKNGYIFGLGIFFIFFSMSNAFGSEIFGQIMNILAITCLLTGLAGLFDKYLLINKEEKNKIRNIWIAKILGEK